MADKAPIFIVGAPRSGTTLLAAMLSAHSQLQCGPETHFFRYLANTKWRKLTKRSVWPQAAAEFLSTMTINGQKVHEAYNISVPRIKCILAIKSPSVANMLKSVTETFARDQKKTRWIEKTPNHILYLSDIRRWFPTAWIVRIVRDPRDVAISMRKLPWASQSLLNNLYVWREWDERSWQFFQRDCLATTVRYEDLLSDSNNELARLCGLIGERFEDNMLDVSGVASLLSANGEMWKAQVAKPLDRTRAYSWKENFPTDLKRPAELICFEGLKRYGYETSYSLSRTIAVSGMPNEADIAKRHRIITTANQGARILPVTAAGKRVQFEILREADEVFFDQVPYLGRTTLERIRNVFAICWSLARRRLSARTTFWCPRSNAVAVKGRAEWLLRAMFNAFCVKADGLWNNENICKSNVDSP